MRTAPLGILSLAALSLVAAPSFGQVPHDVAELEILEGWREADGTHVAGLRLTLAEGWKTYWRSPGDGGIPPRLLLNGASNVEGLSIAWPVPEVFDQNGLRSIGYTDQVVLPVRIRPKSGDAPLRLEGKLEIGVCEDVCIPMNLSVSALLPETTSSDAEITAALGDRPVSAAEAGVSNVRCSVRPISDGLTVTAEVAMPSLGADEIAVLELPDRSIWISEADMERDGGTLHAVVDMVPPDGTPFALDRSDVRITVIGGGTAVDIRGCG